jgi:hypothetical protein
MSIIGAPNWGGRRIGAGRKPKSVSGASKPVQKTPKTAPEVKESPVKAPIVIAHTDTAMQESLPDMVAGLIECKPPKTLMRTAVPVWNDLMNRYHELYKLNGVAFLTGISLPSIVVYCNAFADYSFSVEMIRVLQDLESKLTDDDDILRNESRLQRFETLANMDAKTMETTADRLCLTPESQRKLGLITQDGNRKSDKPSMSMDTFLAKISEAASKGNTVIDLTAKGNFK